MCGGGEPFLSGLDEVLVFSVDDEEGPDYRGASVSARSNGGENSDDQARPRLGNREEENLCLFGWYSQINTTATKK